jgi:hypothetical protein
MRQWIIVCTEQDRCETENNLVRNLQGQGNLLKSFRPSLPSYAITRGTDGRDYIDALEQEVHQNFNGGYSEIDSVVFVLNRAHKVTDDETYRYIKKRMYINGKQQGGGNGSYVIVPTQCVRADKFMHKYLSIATNISVQLANKTGHTTRRLVEDLPHWQNTLICAIDRHEKVRAPY